MLPGEDHLRIIIRGVPGREAGGGGRTLQGYGSREQREINRRKGRWEARNTGGRYRNRKGEQACTQHDQVFIANFMDLVKKAYTLPLSQRKSNVRSEMLCPMEWSINYVAFLQSQYYIIIIIIIIIMFYYFITIDSVNTPLFINNRSFCYCY
jgi:hypothetical protein